MILSTDGDFYIDTMQLLSKMRYIAAQFEALFERDLWLINAQKSNAMAQLLAKGVSSIPGIRITRPVEANGVFVHLPKDLVERLLQTYFFYCMDETEGEYRFMTSFDTDEEDVLAFIQAVKDAAIT